jgi:hypothetical protein
MNFLKKGKKQSMRNTKKSPIHLEHLISYLKLRSKVEGVGFKLNDKFFIDNFNYGLRIFFGVTVDENGFPLFDEQQPSDSFYEDFLFDYYSTIFGLKITDSEIKISV